MADRGDTHYSVRGLNAWFAISSLLLLVSFVWMMLDDWQRPWKDYQREFRRIEVEQARAEQLELERQGALESESRLEERVAQAQKEIESRSSELEAARETLRLVKGDLWNAIEAAKKLKSQFNWDRWEIEAQRLEAGNPELRADRLAEIEKAMNTAMTVQEQKQLAADEAQAALDALEAVLDNARKELVAGTRDLDQVRARLDKLAPSGLDAQIADVIRDAPGIDFVDPNLQVEKVVLANLTFELNFTKKKRIDMCTTCHLGSDSAGFEEQPQPFTTHPRLDLFLTAKSPHPFKDVGCTICHRGAGEALDFVRADHRADSPEQAEEWYDEYGWHKQHHWDYPMLAESFTESSCVQCHKTSMDLIAEDAPRVSQGYQLFERYGCYSCHKVDWFQTSRRPGPSLVNLQAKLSPEFIEAWIADPKAFRPTTWMPQFFHLENYAPDESVVDSKWGQGREILGQEWNDAAVAATAAFLRSRAPEQAFPPVPVAGDAHRGREAMRLNGCLACHNMAPYDGEPVTRDLALEKRGTNEHGPNLRGVATKVTPEWLYAWLKDPAAYWPDTRMPDLRLSDQDAADITAYMTEDPDGIFSEVPEGWKEERVQMPEPQLREVLGEQARWFYARDGRATVEARLEGRDADRRWDDIEALKVAVGEKLVANYGCFSCHEISGMQDMMPIGTELSNWGSKTVDKLDFGFGAALFGLDHNYREGWLMQKLHAPRSYDQRKVKNPTEKLRMPWFDFSEDQVQSIATFVVGLVDDEVQRAKMEPTQAQLAMDDGMRAVRQKNCVACHMIDPGTATYEDEQGLRRTVVAELLPIDEARVPPLHTLESVRSELEYWEADEVGLRILGPEPGIGMDVGDKLFVPADKLLELSAPNGGDFVALVNDYYFNGIELYDAEAENEDDAFYYVSGAPDDGWGVEDADGQFRDHSSEPLDKLRWTYAPPVLWDEGGKVHSEWFYGFLSDVVPIRPQIRVRMPSFHYSEGEAAAIADYFAHKSKLEWPARFARRLRLADGRTLEELAAGAGIGSEAWLAIEQGSAPDIAASFDKLEAFARSTAFTDPGPVDTAYEASRLRSHAYLAERAEAFPKHLETGERIVTEAVNCYQCHFRLGEPPAADPIAWAPDMARVHERLREEWVLPWLRDPASIYPGTAMPANFAGDPPQYQEFFPDSDNAQQLQVVMEWLYNFDRIYLGQKIVETAATGR